MTADAPRSPVAPASDRTEDRPGTRTAQASTLGFRAALDALAAAQKSRKGAPAYSVLVNRRLGRVLAAAAHQARLTPDVVTAISGLCTFTAIVLIAVSQPTAGLGAAVAALLVLGYALDAADGQLARLHGGGSVAGEWLDHIVDAAKISTLHLAVLLCLHRGGDVTDPFLLVPLGFSAVACLSFFAQLLNEQLVRAATGGATGATSGQASWVVSFLKAPTDYGLLCLSFLLLGTAAFPVAYAVLAAGSAAYLALALGKWYGDMRHLDREGAL